MLDRKENVGNGSSACFFGVNDIVVSSIIYISEMGNSGTNKCFLVNLVVFRGIINGSWFCWA